MQKNIAKKLFHWPIYGWDWQSTGKDKGNGQSEEDVGGRTSNNETASWNSVTEKKENSPGRKECLSNHETSNGTKKLQWYCDFRFFYNVVFAWNG